MTDKTYKEIIERNDEVIIKFGAEWCGPCRMIDPIIEDLKESDAFQYQIHSVDVDDNPEISRNYAIRNIPTVIFIKNGEVSDKLVGAFTEEQFVLRTEHAFPIEDAL